MSAGLHLTIATPTAVLVDADVRSLRAEDGSGAFGVLPGHADLLTALPPSVVRWTREGAPTCYCAVSGGVLTVSGGNQVSIACRQGVLGDDLAPLQAEVKAQRAAEQDVDRRARIEQARLHALGIRLFMRYLRPGRDSPAAGDAPEEPETPS